MGPAAALDSRCVRSLEEALLTFAGRPSRAAAPPNVKSASSMLRTHCESSGAAEPMRRFPGAGRRLAAYGPSPARLRS